MDLAVHLHDRREAGELRPAPHQVGPVRGRPLEGPLLVAADVVAPERVAADGRLAAAGARGDRAVCQQRLELALEPLPGRGVREIDRTTLALPPRHVQRRAALGLAHKKAAVHIRYRWAEVLARHFFELA